MATQKIKPGAAIKRFREGLNGPPAGPPARPATSPSVVPSSKSPGKRVPSSTPRLAASNRAHSGRPARDVEAGDPGSPRPRTVREIANDLLIDPEGWLQTSNPQFGGRRPIDLVGTDEECRVSNLLLAAEQGFFS